MGGSSSSHLGHSFRFSAEPTSNYRPWRGRSGPQPPFTIFAFKGKGAPFKGGFKGAWRPAPGRGKGVSPSLPFGNGDSRAPAIAPGHGDTNGGKSGHDGTFSNTVVAPGPLGHLATYQRLRACFPWWEQHAPIFVQTLILGGVEPIFHKSHYPGTPSTSLKPT